MVLMHEILEYLTRYTYHVLDEYGRPARIPVSLIRYQFSEKYPDWINVLRNLNDRKWITAYDWTTNTVDNKDVKVTTEGAYRTDIYLNRPDNKRILLWYEQHPVLIDYTDWSKLDFYYNNNGEIVYRDKLALIKLMMGFDPKRNIE